MSNTIAQAYIQIMPSTDGIEGDLQKQLNEPAEKAGTSAGKKAGSGLSKAFSSVGNIGGTLTKGVTVPLVAMGAASAAAFKQVDAGADTIVQKTGASGNALEAMQTSMSNLATSIPVSFEDAGSAIGEVNTRFGLTGDKLESLSGQFLKFAQLNGTDVSSSVDSTSKVLAAFGMSADDASGMLDVMNSVGQATGVDMGSLGEALSANAAQFQSMGLNATQSAQLIGQFSMAGMDTSTAMMGLKTAMKNAASDGQTLNDKLKTFSETMSGSGSESDKLAAAYELFGTRAGGAFYNAYAQGTLSLDNLDSSMSDFGGSVSDTFENTLDPIDRFQTSLNTLMDALAPLFNSLSSALAPVLEEVASVITQVSEAFQSLSPEMQQAIVKVLLITAAAGPLMQAITGTGSGLGTLIGSFGGFGNVLNATNPIILAIGAAIAGVVLVIQNWGSISEWFSGVWDTVSSSVSGMWESMKSKCSETFSNMQQSVEEHGGGIKGVIGAAGEQIQTVWGNAFTQVDNLTGGKLSSALATVKDKMSSIKENVSSRLASVKSAFSNKLSSVATTVSSKMSSIKSHFSEKMSGAYSVVSNKLSSIKNAFKSKMDSAKNTVKSAIDKIKGFFNFSWHLPKLSLPHISITGHFSLNPPSAPHFGISWDAKAMNQPYLYTQATLFGAGEVGDEVMYGRQNLLNDIREATSGNGGGDTYNITMNVSGAENPEEWAENFSRKLKMKVRMA